MTTHRIATPTVIRFALATCALGLAGAASAQLLSSAALERATIKPGEAAKLTAQFDVLSGTNCGVRVHWGDGSSENFKINQAKDVPLVASHTYAKAGRYTVKVEPKTMGMTMPRCGGSNQEVALTVSGAAAKKAKAAPVRKSSTSEKQQ